MSRLPEALRAQFTPKIVEEAIKHDSHYPDRFQPFLPEEVGDKAIAVLKLAGLKSRYDLHLDHGRVAGFAQLVEAIREGG